MRDWVLRFKAVGQSGLLTGKAPGCPYSRRPVTRSVAAGRGGRPEPIDPWSCPLTVDRPGEMGIRGVPGLDLETVNGADKAYPIPARKCTIRNLTLSITMNIKTVAKVSTKQRLYQFFVYVNN